MSEYRRRRAPGGTYFFTACLADRRAQLLIERIGLLRDVVRLTRKRMPFTIDCAVVLPAEMHMIWTMPEGDDDYPARWRLLKSTFSRHVRSEMADPPPTDHRGDAELWQRRYWEHLIRDDADHVSHRAFILMAPVRAGLVTRPEDWPFSSIHQKALPGLPDHPVEPPRRVA